MKPVRPKALVYRGVVEASGFFIDPSIVGDVEARRRILAAWTAHTRAYEAAGGLLMLLPGPVRVDGRVSPGTPLVEHGGCHFGAPLADDELRALAPSTGCVVLAGGGSTRVVEPGSLVPLRPEAWIDLSELEVETVASLGRPPRPPREAAAPVNIDARVALTGASASAEHLSVLGSLRSGSKDAGAAGAGGSSAADMAKAVKRRLGSFAKGAAGEAASVLGDVASGIRNLFGSGSGQSGFSGAPRERSGWLLAFERGLRRFAERALLASRLGHVIGRRQAEFLEKTIDMFDRGDLDEALRHAIPIDAVREFGSAGTALGRLSVRNSLSITPQRAGSATSVHVPSDFLDLMRKAYRAAFERLEAQGRIEEAAFVLAELLNADEEAVAFLERHGRLRLAAEIAEARRLVPGLVVRQWFLAGERERAIAIARRTGAFADAVLRLGRTHAEESVVLRLLWATSLADGGDFLAAAVAAEPVTSARALMLNWLDGAIEAGGVAGAKALARKGALAPESIDDLWGRVRELLDDESGESARARQAFAMELTNVPRVDAIRHLAREAVRSSLRDASSGHAAAAPHIVKMLVDVAKDGALRADLVAPEKPVPADIRQAGGLQFRVEAADTGALPSECVAPLEGGRWLVGLGDAGAVILNRNGRTVARIDEPAHAVVVSDVGNRAILLGRRGEVWRLARVDLVTARATTWCEARLDAFADSYDGSSWFVASDGDFFAVDATAQRFDALWRVPDVPGRTVEVTRTSFLVWFLTPDGNGHPLWRYATPGMWLRSRAPIEDLPGFGSGTVLSCVAVDPHTLAAIRWTHPAGIDPAPQTISACVWRGDRLSKSVQLSQFLHEPELLTGRLESGAGWLVVPMIDNAMGGAVIRLLDLDGMVDSSAIVLEGATRVATRVRGEVLAIADDRGRCLAIDLVTGNVLGNVRLN